ncbi:MAG: helix-turn-helix domain-containing protein [Pseudomonadota bacterium]
MSKRIETKGNLLQTLRRGMDTISFVSEHPSGVSIAQIAEKLKVDRAVAYRIVATLEADAFVSRATNGNIFLGGALLALASNLEPQLRSIAEPALHRLAEETQATAFMSVARGKDAVAILVAESEAGLIRVGYRVGSRHPLERGAAGIAILAGRTETSKDAEEVLEARRQGYSITRGQLQRGAVGIAAPLHFAKLKHSGVEASIGVVALDDLDTQKVAPLVIECARQVSASLGE